MIERIVVARCDGVQMDAYRCLGSASLDPDTTQPFLDLQKLGWTLDPDGERIYCPRKHRKPKEKRS